MQFNKLAIVTEKKAKEEGYNAFSSSLPGCFSNGRAIEEAKRNMREAIQQHVTSLLVHVEAVPQNERLVHVEEAVDRAALTARMPQVTARVP